MDLETTTGAVTLEAARTAVLVIDMQNDFVSKGGAFDRAGIDLSTVRRTIGPTVAVLEAARDYSCVLLADCTAEPIGSDLPRTNHEATLLLIQALFGWVSTSDAFLQALAEDPIAGARERRPRSGCS